ncbi:aldo/keto reductase [Paenibacillus sp. GCM10027627]|uniref:aldo/keto reductase n=1 Tax=unclassified Paenibacillus TaxID=185978 RepID=UPI003625370B
MNTGMKTVMKKLGKSDIEVSPLGLGCWAIGGLFTLDGIPDGWGEVNDEESIRAIHAAIDRGITFFDTADAYGTGHSEAILGKAVKNRRDQVVIATKFGYTNNELTKEVFGRHDVSPEYIRYACERSLRHLGTDYIDLYQIHAGGLSGEEMDSAIGTLNELQQEGLIRSYGWSTWDPERAESFAKRSKAVAIQHTLNVLRNEEQMVSVCERYGLSSINNSPLAMGLLSGKFNQNSKLPDSDVRGSSHEWVTYFKDGKPSPEYLEKLNAVKELLGSDGRTLVQGALAWIWGRSNAAIPIPGFKTTKQVEELADAISFGPLSKSQMDEIEKLLRFV